VVDPGVSSNHGPEAIRVAPSGGERRTRAHKAPRLSTGTRAFTRTRSDGPTSQTRRFSVSLRRGIPGGGLSTYRAAPSPERWKHESRSFKESSFQTTTNARTIIADEFKEITESRGESSPGPMQYTPYLHGWPARRVVGPSVNEQEDGAVRRRRPRRARPPGGGRPGRPSDPLCAHCSRPTSSA